MALLTIVLSACKDDDKPDNSVNERVNALTLRIEALNDHLIASDERIAELENELADTRQQILTMDQRLTAATQLLDEWMAGTMVVKVGAETVGPVLAYYGDAVAAVDYDERVVLVPISSDGEVPYFGKLHFDAANCTGTPYLQLEPPYPSVDPDERAGVLELSSGLVYEENGPGTFDLNTVASRKNWRDDGCENLSPGTMVYSVAAKTRARVTPSSGVSITPRSLLQNP